ncbi:methyl-accepting chemotaxis protein [Altericroceibacterium xinjiangense]|uniref:methyl-accepting chemotaxis protein n=1 Tax=Altericroceibacterium xinjiangense TaxID=762261 RepID=UPI001F49568C|nr:methyl-accepting chemotaxis protein [Altericroceibacterium xinjiangense]
MGAFSSLRISHKIMLGLALLAALSVFIAGFGTLELSRMAGNSRALIDKQAESMKLAAQANENKSRMHQIWYATVIENDLPDFRKHLDDIAAEREELTSRLDALRPFMDGEDTQRFARLERGLADYYKATDTVPALWMAGQKEAAEDVIQHPAREAYEIIDEVLGEIVQAQDQELETGAAAMDAQSASVIWTLALVSFIGIAVICGVLIVVVRRQVTGPIVAMTGLMDRLANGDNSMDVPYHDRRDEVGNMARAVLVFRDNARSQAAAQIEKARADAEQKQVVDTLSDGLGRLAKGDLTFEIEAQFSGAYEQVKANFNGAVESLRDLISRVIVSAQTLRTGSQEIAQAAEDLARRTEGNAASLEETSASLTEIDGRIKATAAAAERTVVRADEAISSVSGGRSIAGEAVQAMGRVRESARSIDEVIEGVDKIAFQTRVLAMNAAVEAGRAGEAGRGFAVVADLVSALAVRAEEEARRARDQLTVTQTDIVAAVGAVQRIDDALTDISEGVGEVHGLLGSMATDNQAQASAITQISVAVHAMDHSTQQNAAMVEETSAAARNLSSEVHALAEQTTRFRIEGQPRGKQPNRLQSGDRALPGLAEEPLRAVALSA